MRYWIAAFWLALAVSSATAQTAPYRFDLLAEHPTSQFLNPVRILPALNDAGTVAYVVPQPGAPSSYEEVLYTGTPGNLRPVDTPGYWVAGGVSINNHGRIAFIGMTTSPNHFLEVHAVTPGGPVATIRPDQPTIAGELDLDGGGYLETAIADTGAVIALLNSRMGFSSFAFTGDGTAPATYVYQTHSPAPQPIGGYHAILRGPRMSSGGDWVVKDTGLDQPSYTGFASSQGLFRGGSFFNGFTTVGASDVAGDGVVVFQGQKSGEATTRLFTFHNNSLTGTIPGSEGLSSGVVAMNDAGVVALLDGSRTAPDELRLLKQGMLQTVLTEGDPLLGSTVSSINFDPKGFNNAEQFALLVGLADGRDVYVLASPVPEPAAGCAGVMLALFALCRRPKRRGTQ